jgi:hypothetical protein
MKGDDSGLLLALRAEQRASGRADHPPPPFLESDYYSPAPSPDAAIFFILGFGKNFWAIFLGRISNADRAAGPPLDVGERSQRPHTPRGARL